MYGVRRPVCRVQSPVCNAAAGLQSAATGSLCVSAGFKFAGYFDFLPENRYLLYMNSIPDFPEFLPVSVDMRDELTAFCRNLKTEVSEFTFANIFLDSNKYAYRIARLSETSLAVAGTGPVRVFNGKDLGASFFWVMGDPPSAAQRAELFAGFGYWKNMDAALYVRGSAELEREGFQIAEDRDNFDYVYIRAELAALSGKAFHKKKNLVNAFINSYASEVKPLDTYTLPDALSVLESWKQTRPAEDPGDYAQCLYALEHFSLFGFSGIVAYADGVPAGFSVGEISAGGTMFIDLFEKGINSYKGIYQFVNQAQALQLPPSVQYVNREQDLGNEGLRQAKMTYRPHTFVKKYLVLPPSMC